MDDDAPGDVSAENMTMYDGFFPMHDGMQVMDPCNGDPGTCGKTCDTVAYATAHAAMAYAFPPFVCPAQTETVRSQLDHGIRGLDFEVHVSTELGDGGPTLALCLGTCAAGALRMDVALGDVSSFLAVNPREVVTLMFEGVVDAAELQAAIVAAGLDHYALSRAMDDPWPTLHSMITAGTRIVVFADVTGTPCPVGSPEREAELHEARARQDAR
jgi:hypothetical protein